MLMHALAIWTMWERHFSSRTTALRECHERWLGPGADVLEQLAIASMNSKAEKGGHSMGLHVGISLRMPGLTGHSLAELYVWWRAIHNRSGVVQGILLYLMASTAGRFLRLTQFMRSQGRLLVVAISWIFSSKKEDLDFLTHDLKAFQSSKWPEVLYLERVSEHSWFHHSLEYLVMNCSREKVSQASLRIHSMSRENNSMALWESNESELRAAISFMRNELKLISSSLSCLMLLLTTLMSDL